MRRGKLSKVATAVLAVAMLSQCEDQLGGKEEVYWSKDRQSLEAAKDAGEWVERLKVDLSEEGGWRNKLGHLYAELPPREEWQKAFDLADKELNATTEKNEARSGLRVMLQLLDGDLSKAELLVKKSVKAKTNIHEYERAYLLRALYAVATDQTQMAGWIKANKPELLVPREDSGWSSSAKEAWDTDLAKGRVDEGLKKLWKVAQSKKDDTSRRGDALTKIYKVCDLLEREDEAQRAYEQLVELYKHSQTSSSSNLSLPRCVVAKLTKTGQWDVLEDLISREVVNAYDGSGKNRKQWSLFLCQYYTQSPTLFASLIDAVAVKSGMTELLFFDMLDHQLSGAPSLGELYVEALLSQDRTEDAWAVVSRLVIFNRGNDAHFELAHKVGGEKFSALLDQLTVYDPFEERPLIWKAKLALSEGNVVAARQSIEAAIALDPSDGDQGKDARMHAYAVLASVYEAEGNAEKAAFFREVVSAIRDGERADDFLYAGLEGEAIKRYQASLGRFSDAYCLQSRLALTLAENGRFEEAIPHFEKAFNLMPVSFGPRESHCFGCEGLYDDKRVRPIAKRILSEFIKKHPDNPRAPYLLGMVLDEMGQEEAANEAYRKALELDPNYFNAADKLLDNYLDNPELVQQSDALIQEMLGITPYAQLEWIYSKRTDLQQAWVDAGAHAVSPFSLAAMPWKFAVPQEQYMESSGFSYYSHEEDVKAIDGWSRAELLRENEFLESLRSVFSTY